MTLCDHQQRAGDKLSMFFMTVHNTRDKMCTERQEDSGITMRNDAFPDAPTPPLISMAFGFDCTDFGRCT